MNALPESRGPLRPRDFALLMLASGDLLPRQRARDQQADRAGMDLKRQLLDAVAARDPEPEELEEVLMDLVVEQTPVGPMRAIAGSLLEEWRMAADTPEWVEFLLGEAVGSTGVRNQRSRVTSQESAASSLTPDP
jgi:hypothetical protein